MMMLSHHFQIEQLRMKSNTKAVEALVMLILAFFITALLPNILIRAVMGANPMQEPPAYLAWLVENMQLITFGLGVGYFLFAFIGNFMREMKANALEKELEALLMADESCDCCCGGGCGCEDGSCGESCACDDCKTEEASADGMMAVAALSNTPKEETKPTKSMTKEAKAKRSPRKK